MNAADKWCVGYRRNPHVPSGGLIQINAPRRVRFCRDCWRAWTDDPEANR